MLFQSGFVSKRRVLAPNETEEEAKRNESSDTDELRLAKFKPSNRGDYIDILTPEVIGKYIYTLVDQVDLNGRSAFVVAFKPKHQNLPGKKLTDRVLNKAEGKLWIDAEEFELAQAQVRLNSEISVGGGLIGSLKRAAVTIERIRLPEGIWFDRSMKTDYEARKLMEFTRVITKSETRNFQKLSTEG